MEKILEVEGLTKKFNKFTLDDVTFHLERGYILGLIGPNGAGKSTTIKLIMNLINPDKGKIRIFGKNNNISEIKDKIGFVYDELYIYEDIKLKEAKYIISKFYKNWNDKEFNNLIKKFDLDLNKKIKALSRGMKIKFSIAIALSHNAELLIMDEPTSGLDPLVRREILEILQNYIENDKHSVIFSTHITSDLDKIADYIVFLNNGKIILNDEKDKILENYVLVKGPKEIFNDLRDKVIGFKNNSLSMEALMHKENTKKLQGTKCMLERPTLEDIMFFMTRGNAKCLI